MRNGMAIGLRVIRVDAHDDGAGEEIERARTHAGRVFRQFFDRHAAPWQAVRGHVFDNIFVERLWRTVKYEEVYLKNYQNVREARTNLGAYFRFYNQDRPHQALDYRTPAEMYFGGQESQEADWVSNRAMAATPVALRAPSVAAISGV